MKKEWFLDRYCNQQVVALLEDGKLTEYAAEEEAEGELVGNIYKGKVVNVLAGMQAAFVRCGLEKNCYLSTDEAYADLSKYDGLTSANAGGMSEIKEGDEVLVQVVQAPRGNKGAKVTTNLSFVGKNLIYLPGTEFIGISRKITDEKVKEEVLKTTEKFREKGEGFVVRTSAPCASKKTLKKEYEYLKKLWAGVKDRSKNAFVGTLLYRDLDLPMRVIRESDGDEIEAIHVGDKELYERIKALAKLRGEVSEKKIHFHDSGRSMMHEYGISRLIAEATNPRVELVGGGDIVIEHTEAMTVVDVNTGKYVGERSLEETVFCVNMRAAEEIARQVRLRNVGGIVVVDFIDMADPMHREAVTEKLQELLLKDKAKCHVLPMSELCLSQFTRKRVGSEVLNTLVKPCKHCGGKGHVPDDVFLISWIRAEILDRIADGYSSVVVELNAGIMKKILSEGLFSIEAKTRWKNNRIYFIPHKTYPETEYSVTGDNSGVLNLPDNAQILY